MNLLTWLRAPILVGALAAVAHPAEPIDIGSRLELMVDEYLIDSMTGVSHVLHKPTPREIVIVHDEPWEGNGCGYHSVFQDGDRYRMYYKGVHYIFDKKAPYGLAPIPNLFACYAESRDGIHWTKPDLGLIEFKGSKHNNIVMATGPIGKVVVDACHVAVCRDENPDCPPDAKYKAFFVTLKSNPNGVIPFRSADGLRWEPMSDEAVISEGGHDSQNTAFWDPIEKQYRAYWRYWTEGRRNIGTATSKDLLQWSKPMVLQYPGAPVEQLYTNAIKPYHRAPHILVGFPTRYLERGWSQSMRELPDPEFRKELADCELRYGTALTEGLFMTSRDRVTFKRWPEAFLRPGPERPDTWIYGDHYIGWHLVETASALPGAPNELSLYASEGYERGKASRLRRYTLRMDGFVSVQAPLAGGEFVTKPLVFTGAKLVMNCSTSAAGSVQVEIQTDQGKPITNFALADCPEIFGDSLQRTVNWKGGSDVSSLAGKPVRLRFVLKDADLYAIQFR